MDLNLDERDRPSRLELARYATGELSEAEAHALEARLDDEARAFLAELEQARRDLPPVDLASLRDRAASLPPDPVREVAPPPAPANRGFRAWMAGLVLLAAVLVAVLVPVLSQDPRPGAEDPLVTEKSGDVLMLLHFRDHRLEPYRGEPLGGGDVLAFEVGATGHDSVVILSMDGLARSTVFFPSEGRDAEPLEGEGMVRLMGSVVLDRAPGPEIFVAFFDLTAEEALERTFEVWERGGAEALLDYAEAEPDVDAVRVERRL